MQMMSWTIARLGSRFSLLFEPHQRRVLHSAMGRFLDQPLDLMVGLEEPDGTQRVLPFTTDGELLMNPEQFERINSVTYRGYSEKYRLRFEFNVHSVFYPQNERLCTLPAFYLEMRVNPVQRVRWKRPAGPTPDKVKLFIRLRRPDTKITAMSAEGSRPAQLDLSYQTSLKPRRDLTHPVRPDATTAERIVDVHERIISLNPTCTHLEDGDGLTCELPVTETGSGIKWRLIWAAHVADPVLEVKRRGETHRTPFRYTEHWSNLDEVIQDATASRDEHLAHSRRFEKLLEQAPLEPAERHLLNQGFQSWLSNTFWCSLPGDEKQPFSRDGWFSVWEGSCFFHSTIDVEYNIALLYLTLWPRLLALQLDQWSEHEQAHEASQGSFLSHDMGVGSHALGQAYPHEMEVEENCNYLLLLQAYTHWTGDKTIATAQADLVERLSKYLVWSDRDGSGFPSEGVANTIDDASPAVQFARKQTYLAVKRAMALRAASTVLTVAAREEPARRYEDLSESDIRKIEQQAWLGDHYAVCVDPSATGVNDAWTGKPLPFEKMPGWDAHSIYTTNGLLLPMLVGQPNVMDEQRLRRDIISAMRENLSRYGCGHTSLEPENVWVSQNLWRDITARYLGLSSGLPAQYYWDLQVMSNTHTQSYGFIDTYINNNLSFYPRGITVIGLLLAGPRLIIDRLAAAGTYITVEPDRHRPQRWPLLPLADWRAGKIPVCVVDEQGRVIIEGKIDPVVVHGDKPGETANAGLIG